MTYSAALTRMCAVLLALTVAQQTARLPARAPDPIDSAEALELSGLPVRETASAAPSSVPFLMYGRARMIHAPTACDTSTFGFGGPGAPYFVADGWPRANRPFRVDWTTKPTMPKEMPALPAMLFISFDMMTPASMDTLGAPGCWLMVPPDNVMVPQPGTILTQDGGRISLDWTPQISVIGENFYAQLYVHAPGANAAGFLLSPVLHAQVGF